MDTGSVDTDRFAIVRLFNELRNTPPIGAVGLREFRDLLASLFPEFDSVRDAELDSFLDQYVQETMAPRSPEQDWERMGEGDPDLSEKLRR